jgi:hypothetical protein
MHLPCLAFAWLLAASLPGTVPIELIDGRPVVDGVFINGHGPYRFLVDTATTLNHIDPALANSIGLAPTFRTELASSIGTAYAPGSDGVEISLGGDARVTGQKLLFSGMDVVGDLSSGIQGILGQAFLSRFDYLLDLRRKRLEFGVHDFLGARAEGPRAPFQSIDGRAAISTSLGDLVLDSGAAQLILFGVAAEGFPPTRVKTLTGSLFAGMVYRSLAIAGRRVWSGAAIAIPNRNEPGVSGLMPVSLFQSVYVCNSQSYIVLK